MANLTICSFNCQGLECGTVSKRRDVLKFLKGKAMSIYLQQDPHFIEEKSLSFQPNEATRSSSAHFDQTPEVWQ